MNDNTSDEIAAPCITRPCNLQSAGAQSTCSIIIEVSALLMALAIGLLVRSTLYESAVVSGRSMEPTLKQGDRLLVSKTAYRDHSPERGDIVLALVREDHGDVPVVKRVVGLPGEEIIVAGGRLFINRRAAQEPYLKERPYLNLPRRWIVPKEHVFLLGDNRNRSMDSRDYGPVSRGSFIGKVFCVYYPLSRARKT
ncbi:MAG: signal peptidase I [Armatimonadetes bacterium]|nr:signal peptidase I [Armatimonadota bacterium]PIU66400.1 MAG: signal peptidase I [Armatimonadetes bacterium CG07_land_8_20_14_0_80_59_28]PIY42496.1 MAG: signal peptidase I [Armatimonadetes bacterium CG_4_10_14_3_um_filter_59_10]